MFLKDGGTGAESAWQSKVTQGHHFSFSTQVVVQGGLKIVSQPTSQELGDTMESSRRCCSCLPGDVAVVASIAACPWPQASQPLLVTMCCDLHAVVVSCGMARTSPCSTRRVRREMENQGMATDERYSGGEKGGCSGI